MHNNYSDITDLTDKKPLWFDEHAVPRYCDFAPHEVADIYSDEVALVLIACQNCKYKFLVAFSSSIMTRMTSYESYTRYAKEPKEIGLDEFRLSKNVVGLHYGDVPNIGCCQAGPSMNCDDIKVMEFWIRDQSFQWIRHPEFEVNLRDYEEHKVYLHKRTIKLESMLRAVHENPKYADEYGCKPFEDMVKKFATDDFYKLHNEAKEWMALKDI